MEVLQIGLTSSNFSVFTLRRFETLLSSVASCCVCRITVAGTPQVYYSDRLI